jgi:hypothetical protein
MELVLEKKEKLIDNVTIGSDFEVFMFDNETNQAINAKPYIKGSKSKPFNFDKRHPFYATSLDNVLAEGNIPPVVNPEDFDSNIQHVLNYMESLLPQNHKILAIPAMDMNPKFLKTKEAKEFGCDPDYDAWTLEQNVPPSAKKTNIRTGCCHVHIRYDKMSFNTSMNLIKAMDIFLGVPSIIIEPDNVRKDIYGKAGAFRYDESKTIEYRVLSNHFVTTPELRKWVYNNTMLAIDFINSGYSFEDQDVNSKIINSINNADKVLSNEIIEMFNVPMP